MIATNSIDQDDIPGMLELILAALKRDEIEAWYAGTSPNGWLQYQANCPAHRDQWGSLTIEDSPDGPLELHCRNGCSPASIIKSLRLTAVDVFPE